VRLEFVVKSFLPDSVLAAHGPVEPFAESAPLAWAMAPTLCPGDADAADTCVWYHRVWQYLRLLEIITSIRTNSQFLTDTLGRCAEDHPRALVCGSADYGMLAHVKHAYGNRRLDVTVLDVCPTSLYLNRWYADRFRFGVETVRAGALEYTSDEPFDLICTHNFVGRFDTPTRHRLFARWRALLRPGGIVVTTQRVRPEERDTRSSHTLEQARALSARVAAAAEAFRGALGVDVEELRSAVYEYAVRQGDHSIRAPQEVTDPLKSEGFEIEMEDAGNAAERERDRPRYPFGAGAYRMRVIARKR
jgi:SAM-dependent methyltransferase